MIKKEMRRATQRKDWDTVQKLENILKTREERQKIRTERELAKEHLAKAQAEIRKLNYDVRFSFAAMIFGAVGALSGLVALVKSFINK